MTVGATESGGDGEWRGDVGLGVAAPPWVPDRGPERRKEGSGMTRFACGSTPRTGKTVGVGVRLGVEVMASGAGTMVGW